MKSNFLLKYLMICGVLIVSQYAYAQLRSSNVFLQGKYVEVGVSPQGSYGTSASPPSGYHSFGGSLLGFVADPAMDGWTVGTPPLIGDYFLPGIPTEGWELQVDTGRCQAFNTGGYVGSLACTGGGNISYAKSGSTVSGTWQGMVDSILITQVTTIDTLDLYFTTKVTLTNTSYFPKNDIYYLRTLDPDNAADDGGSYSTNNKIEHQVTDTTVVSAVDPAIPIAYLALGTTDTPATCLIYNSLELPVTVDLSTVFNQTYVSGTYAQGATYDGDFSIGVVIKVAHLATVDSATDSVARETATARLHPANSATITYFYSFAAAATDSAISNGINAKLADTVVASGSNPGSLGIKNVSISDDVKVYPNPAKNIVSITGLIGGDQISVYDMMGRKVNQAMAFDRKVNTLSMNNLATGAYILVVNDANGNVKARVPVRKM